MATGTVKYSALMSKNQDIYAGRASQTWSVEQSGSFPESEYKVTRASIKYDLSSPGINGDLSARQMAVSRRDDGADTQLGMAATGKKGLQTADLNTSVSYEGITSIHLDGVDRWVGQLRSGSYVEITVDWEETQPEVVEPKKPAEPVIITGTESMSGIRNEAVHTDVLVSIEGVNISAEVNRYLLTLSYTDNEEDATDDLQIKLQDAGGIWLRKWLNDVLQEAAQSENGKSDRPSSKGLTICAGVKRYEPSGRVSQADFGSFELDCIKASGPPSTITIKGTSLAYGAGIRTEERDKAWESYTLSKIGKEIATKAGLGFLYDCPEDPFYRRLEQAKQTDIAFLSEICHKNGFSLKVYGGKLIIFDQKRYESLTEAATITWMDGSYTKYDLSTQAGDVHYAECKVKYYHPGLKKMIEGSAKADDYDPESEDNLTLIVTNERVETEDEANLLAAKLLRLHNKYEKKVTFTMLGNPLLGAGLTARLLGFGLWDGKYIIHQCKHEVGTSGYTTKITLRTIPDKNVERSAPASAEEESSSSGQSGSGSKDNKDKSWQTTSSCTVYKSATGSDSVGSLAKGVPITILGSSSGGRTYISGGGKTGYVSTGCIGKV